MAVIPDVRYSEVAVIPGSTTVYKIFHTEILFFDCFCPNPLESNLNIPN